MCGSVYIQSRRWPYSLENCDSINTGHESLCSSIKKILGSKKYGGELKKAKKKELYVETESLLDIIRKRQDCILDIWSKLFW